MPSSGFNQISKIVEVMVGLNPQSILDIGPGFGKYGFLAREYLDLDPKRKDYPGFEKRIDSVEAFKKYLTEGHKFVYDNNYVGDALEIVKKLKERYELVVFIDVIEDMKKEDGEKLLKTILEKNDGLLLSVPKIIWNEGAEYGNKYEIFRSKWSKKELKSFGNCIVIRDPFCHLVYYGNDENIKKLRKAIFRRKMKRIIYSIPFAGKIHHYLSGGVPFLEQK